MRLAERYRIQLLVRFGSTITGRTHASSDVDYGVVLFEPTPGLSRLVDLAADLQMLNPGREVDVAVLNRTDPVPGLRRLPAVPGVRATLCRTLRRDTSMTADEHLVTAAGQMPPNDDHASFVTLGDIGGAGAPGATGRLTTRHYGSFSAALSCAAVSPFTYTGVPASNSFARARPPTTTGSKPASVTSRTVVAMAS